VTFCKKGKGGKFRYTFFWSSFVWQSHLTSAHVPLVTFYGPPIERPHHSPGCKADREMEFSSHSLAVSLVYQELTLHTVSCFLSIKRTGAPFDLSCSEPGLFLSSLYLFVYFAALVLELRAFTLSHYFCEEFFWDRVSWTICLGWLWATILLIPAACVARITGMSH
jgi:hypothetical protein